MPDRSDRLIATAEEAGDGELPYISKSRVMKWIENPEHFRLKYLEDIKEPETEPMIRGSRIHEAFEVYYENRAAGVDPINALPGNRQLWADFVEPYITNFLKWTHERDIQPVSVEEEHWRDPLLDIDGEPEWMGMADAIIPARAFSELSDDEGVVVVDFKTGSVPREQYRGDGIYTELEYYVMLFEDKYNVVGAAAYYPREDTTLVQPESEQQRSNIVEAVSEMVNATAAYDGDTKFETNEGPLCKWGREDDEESAYYGICSQCTWGVPINNEETFKQMLRENYHAEEIADELGTTTDAVYYWQRKVDT